MNSQKLKGFLEGAVLSILENQSRYSQEIVELFNNNGFHSVSSGTIFPLLIRMEQEEIFEITRVKSKVGPPKKYYGLNDKGRAQLAEYRKEWLEFQECMHKMVMGEFDEK